MIKTLRVSLQKRGFHQTFRDLSTSVDPDIIAETWNLFKLQECVWAPASSQNQWRLFEPVARKQDYLGPEEILILLLFLNHRQIWNSVGREKWRNKENERSETLPTQTRARDEQRITLSSSHEDITHFSAERNITSAVFRSAQGCYS